MKAQSYSNGYDLSKVKRQRKFEIRQHENIAVGNVYIFFHIVSRSSTVTAFFLLEFFHYLNFTHQTRLGTIIKGYSLKDFKKWKLSKIIINPTRIGKYSSMISFPLYVERYESPRTRVYCLLESRNYCGSDSPYRTGWGIPTDRNAEMVSMCN